MTNISNEASTDTLYIVVPKNEYELYNQKESLTQFDAERILQTQDSFIKFLNKSRFNYQIELSKGTYKGREQDLYRAIDVCDELIKGIKNIETAFKKYNESLQEDI